MPLAWLIHLEDCRASLSDLGWIGVLFAIVFMLLVRDCLSAIAISPVESKSNTIVNAGDALVDAITEPV